MTAKYRSHWKHSEKEKEGQKGARSSPRRKSMRWMNDVSNQKEKGKKKELRACLQNFLPRAVGPDLETLLPATGKERHRTTTSLPGTW